MADENKDQNEQSGGVEGLDQTLDQTQEFLEKNKQMINRVLIVLIVVMGGYLVYQKIVKEPAEEDSMEALWEAQYVFEEDSFVNASELFEEIAQDYGNTEAGNVANLYLGISLMKQGDFDAAIEALEDFDGKGYFMPAIATGLTADCYSENGEYEKAVDLYKKGAKQADSKVYSPYYLKKAGLLLEQNEEPSKAVELYQSILDKYYYEDITEYRKERGEIVTYLERAKTSANNS